LAESNREDADKQLAADIASEAEHLQKNIGGFLTRSNAAGAAAGI
jgi:hypothetical protein